jgi:shikimate dehydrogenase
VTDRAQERVGLIGWPVEHSLSPAMHDAAFAALGLDWRYELLPTRDDRVAARLEHVRHEYRGVNVTVPHKQRVIPYLDRIDEAAAMIGAVNTISVRDGELVGYNTDAAGFLTALTEAGFSPAGRQALLLGAGGAARAVAAALAGAGCTVTLYNRRPERAVELANSLGEAVQGLTPGTSLHDLELAHFDLLVNATPVGMWPAVGACPWPEELPLLARWTVYDLVYNPNQTRLMKRAHAAGASTIGGLEMLVHQGALALTLWTGRQAPVEVMRAAAQAALGADQR